MPTPLETQDPAPVAAHEWAAPAIDEQPPAIPPGADPLLGASVGSFRIQRLLGLGGMGAVYLAEQPLAGNKVAIRFLHDSIAQNPDTIWRFYQEARAAHVVGHENIVGIYDLNLLPPKRYYVAMEYLEGETLSQRLLRAEVPAESALRILIQLCEALQCAHEAGVVHRDLRPDNIFLVERRGQKDFVKLVDFGLARLREVFGGWTTTGTPEYRSPEQREGREADARSDLYGLGLIACRLATGQLPLQMPELPGTPLQQTPLAGSPEAPLDPRLAQAILRATARAPEERFQNARELGAVLQAVLDDLRRQHRAQQRNATGAAEATRGLEVPPPTLDPEPDEAAEMLLARYRVEATHYQLLDLPLDAEFADVVSRGGRMRRDLEALRARKLSPAQAAETDKTLARVAAALVILSSMEKRIAYDGELGNFAGVARARAAGLSSLRLDEAHARFREAHPGIDPGMEEHLGRIQRAQALGNLEEVARECEQALRLDPLNRALHEAYVEARASR